MADRIPNELWLKALGFAPTEALTRISTTSRRFCSLSRPHIFAEFRFHPYAIGDQGLLLPNPRRMKKASERLKFWLSDEIAPFVRVCSITPFTGPKTSKFSTSDEPYTLLAAFFDGLGIFTGLQILTADKVHFTQIGVSNLCVLPNLHTLRIWDHKVSPGHVINFSGLQLRSLRSLRIPINFMSDKEINHTEWIPLLDAGNLRELELSFNHPRSVDIDLLPQFPHAEMLVVYSSLTTTPQTFRIVAKFPALQSLTLVDMAREDRPWDSPRLQLAPSELPLSLKKYAGPFQALHLLLPLPDLTSITIDAECPPLPFLEELRGIGAPRITSLSLTFAYFNPTLFEQLCEVFPAVIRLHITVGDAEGAPEDWELDDFDPANNDWKVPELLQSLVTSLPPRIKHLALQWYMDFEFTDELPPFRQVSDILMKKHNGLSALWLGMYGYTVRSLKSATGKIAAKEDLADDSRSTVPRIKKDFSSSWHVLAAHV
ncbi:hypothetical protein C8R46DRAFT_1342644 [Mycena filopes]|nr:hypothetical protein C8R46DRAFT_1342644 [Mycena filopes]